MSICLKKKKQSWLYRLFSWCLLVMFTINIIIPPSYAQVLPGMAALPAPTSMIGTTPLYVPALIKGIEIHPDNPLQFDFIIDTGHSTVKGTDLEQEATRMVKYFLAALTVPEKELWVNLSPYEQDRIIPDSFGQTDMGMDLLAQDYILKQLTASLMYPEKELGKKFWDHVYQQVKDRFGTSDVPLDNFNKVWIVPEKAAVYETGNRVFVVNSHLKVLMEQDYVAMQNNQSRVTGNELREDESSSLVTRHSSLTEVQSAVMREIVIPAIEKEVNEGAHFARLRQINQAAILAKWYKQALKESLLGKVYVDQAKMKGIDDADSAMKEGIYQQYLEAFKKGVYDYIKEDIDPQTNEVVPHRYFSGGAGLSQEVDILGIGAMSDPVIKRLIESGMTPAGNVVRSTFALVENPNLDLEDIRRNSAMVFSDGDPAMLVGDAIEKVKTIFQVAEKDTTYIYNNKTLNAFMIASAILGGDAEKAKEIFQVAKNDTTYIYSDDILNLFMITSAILGGDAEKARMVLEEAIEEANKRTRSGYTADMLTGFMIASAILGGDAEKAKEIFQAAEKDRTHIYNNDTLNLFMIASAILGGDTEKAKTILEAAIAEANKRTRSGYTADELTGFTIASAILGGDTEKAKEIFQVAEKDKTHIYNGDTLNLFMIVSAILGGDTEKAKTILEAAIAEANKRTRSGYSADMLKGFMVAAAVLAGSVQASSDRQLADSAMVTKNVPWIVEKLINVDTIDTPRGEYVSKAGGESLGAALNTALDILHSRDAALKDRLRKALERYRSPDQDTFKDVLDILKTINEVAADEPGKTDRFSYSYSNVADLAKQLEKELSLGKERSSDPAMLTAKNLSVQLGETIFHFMIAAQRDGLQTGHLFGGRNTNVYLEKISQALDKLSGEFQVDLNSARLLLDNLKGEGSAILLSGESGKQKLREEYSSMIVTFENIAKIVNEKVLNDQGLILYPQQNELIIAKILNDEGTKDLSYRKGKNKIFHVKIEKAFKISDMVPPAISTPSGIIIPEEYIYFYALNNVNKLRFAKEGRIFPQAPSMWHQQKLQQVVSEVWPDVASDVDLFKAMFPSLYEDAARHEVRHWMDNVLAREGMTDTKAELIPADITPKILKSDSELLKIFNAAAAGSLESYAAASVVNELSAELAAIFTSAHPKLYLTYLLMYFDFDNTPQTMKEYFSPNVHTAYPIMYIIFSKILSQGLTSSDHDSPQEIFDDILTNLSDDDVRDVVQSVWNDHFRYPIVEGPVTDSYAPSAVPEIIFAQNKIETAKQDQSTIKDVKNVEKQLTADEMPAQEISRRAVSDFENRIDAAFDVNPKFSMSLGMIDRRYNGDDLPEAVMRDALKRLGFEERSGNWYRVRKGNVDSAMLGSTFQYDDALRDEMLQFVSDSNKDAALESWKRLEKAVGYYGRQQFITKKYLREAFYYEWMEIELSDVFDALASIASRESLTRADLEYYKNEIFDNEELSLEGHQKHVVRFIIDVGQKNLARELISPRFLAAIIRDTLMEEGDFKELEFIGTAMKEGKFYRGRPAEDMLTVYMKKWGEFLPEVLKPLRLLAKDASEAQLRGMITAQFLTTLARDAKDFDDIIKKLKQLKKGVEGGFDGIRQAKKEVTGDFAMLTEDELHQMDQVFSKIGQREYKAFQTLNQQGWAHLLSDWDSLTDAQKAFRLQQIEEMDWKKAKELQERELDPNKPARAVPDGFGPASVITTLSAQANDAALALLTENVNDPFKSALAFIMVGGGSGSAFESLDPKGTLPGTALSRKSLFESLIKKIGAASRYYGHQKSFPIIIMTSDLTHEGTQKFLEAHDWFGAKDQIILVKQAVFPLFDQKTRLPYINKEGEIAVGANGHGDAFDDILVRKEVQEWLKARGVKAVQYLNIDNPLNPLAEKTMLGELALSWNPESQSNKAHIALGVIARNDMNDRLGLVGKASDGEYHTLNYSQASDNVKKSFAYGDPSFRVAWLESLFNSPETPYRVDAKPDKKDDGRPVFKLEKASDDKERRPESPLVLLDRIDTFEPIKKPASKADKETDATAYLAQSNFWKKRLQQATGIMLPVDWAFEISDEIAFYMTDDELRVRLVQEGVVVFFDGGYSFAQKFDRNTGGVLINDDWMVKTFDKDDYVIKGIAKNKTAKGPDAAMLTNTSDFVPPGIDPNIFQTKLRTELITGGSGFVSASVIQRFMDAGVGKIIILDKNIRNREEISKMPGVEILDVDLADINSLRDVFFENQIDHVTHLAADIEAGTSMKEPAAYFQNNVLNTIRLLDVMKDFDVKGISFASSAGVYEGQNEPLDENVNVNPQNVYGATKRMMEKLMQDYSKAHGIRFAALRFFNVAGAFEWKIDGKTVVFGENHRGRESHIIPIIFEVLQGKRPYFMMFGDNYDTRDGSNVRDYIHVLDLANAIVKTAAWTMADGQQEDLILNLGTGKGTSNFEMLDEIQKVTGKKFYRLMGQELEEFKAILKAIDEEKDAAQKQELIKKRDDFLTVKKQEHSADAIYFVANRRFGDSDSLTAKADRAHMILGWGADHSQIDQLITDAWKYHSQDEIANQPFPAAAQSMPEVSEPAFIKEVFDGVLGYPDVSAAVQFEILFRMFIDSLYNPQYDAIDAAHQLPIYNAARALLSKQQPVLLSVSEDDGFFQQVRNLRLADTARGRALAEVRQYLIDKLEQTKARSDQDAVLEDADNAMLSVQEPALNRIARINDELATPENVKVLVAALTKKSIAMPEIFKVFGDRLSIFASKSVNYFTPETKAGVISLFNTTSREGRTYLIKADRFVDLMAELLEVNPAVARDVVREFSGINEKDLMTAAMNRIARINDELVTPENVKALVAAFIGGKIRAQQVFDALGKDRLRKFSYEFSRYMDQPSGKKNEIVLLAEIMGRDQDMLGGGFHKAQHLLYYRIKTAKFFDLMAELLEVNPAVARDVVREFSGINEKDLMTAAMNRIARINDELVTPENVKALVAAFAGGKIPAQQVFDALGHDRLRKFSYEFSRYMDQPSAKKNEIILLTEIMGYEPHILDVGYDKAQQLLYYRIKTAKFFDLMAELLEVNPAVARDVMRQFSDKLEPMVAHAKKDRAMLANSGEASSDLDGDGLTQVRMQELYDAAVNIQYGHEGINEYVTMDSARKIEAALEEMVQFLSAESNDGKVFLDFLKGKDFLRILDTLKNVVFVIEDDTGYRHPSTLGQTAQEIINLLGPINIDSAMLTQQVFNQMEAINRGGRFGIDYDFKQGHTLFNLTDKKTGSAFSVMPDRGFTVTKFAVNGERDVFYYGEDLEKLRGIFLLGPWVNRLDAARAKAAGFDIEKLMQSDPVFSKIKIDGQGNANHGVLRDLPWTLDYLEENKGDGSISIGASVDFRQYPVLAAMFGEVVYHVTYTMKDNNLSLSYTIENVGTKIAPAFFGVHPCFKVDVKNTAVKMSAQNVFKLNERLLPDGQADARGQGFDFLSGEGLSMNPQLMKLETPVFSDFATDQEGFYTVQIHDASDGATFFMSVDASSLPYFVLWNTDATGQVLGAEPMSIAADHHNQFLHVNAGVDPGKTVRGSFRIHAEHRDSAMITGDLNSGESLRLTLEQMRELYDQAADIKYGHAGANEYVTRDSAQKIETALDGMLQILRNGGERSKVLADFLTERNFISTLTKLIADLERTGNLVMQDPEGEGHLHPTSLGKTAGEVVQTLSSSSADSAMLVNAFIAESEKFAEKYHRGQSVSMESLERIISYLKVMKFMLKTDQDASRSLREQSVQKGLPGQLQKLASIHRVKIGMGDRLVETGLGGEAAQVLKELTLPLPGVVQYDHAMLTGDVARKIFFDAGVDINLDAENPAWISFQADFAQTPEDAARKIRRAVIHDGAFVHIDGKDVELRQVEVGGVLNVRLRDDQRLVVADWHVGSDGRFDIDLIDDLPGEYVFGMRNGGTHYQGPALQKDSQRLISRYFHFGPEQAGKAGLGLDDLGKVPNWVLKQVAVSQSPIAGQAKERLTQNLSAVHDSAMLVNAAAQMRSEVLVVDDDADFLALMQRILAADGFEVAVAENGKEAMEILKRDSGKISMVITDFNMPDMNGIELSRRVAQDFPDLPVMIQSANPKSIDSAEVAVNVQDVLNKDEYYKLPERIKEYLALSDTAMLSDGRAKTAGTMLEHVSNPIFQKEFLAAIGKTTTFAMLKPDALRPENHDDELDIMSELRKYYRIYHGPKIHLSGPQVEEFFRDDKGKDSFERDLMPYISGHEVIPLFLVSLNGEAPVEKLKEVQLELIEEFELKNQVEDRLHASDSTENARREAMFMFDMMRLASLSRQDREAVVDLLHQGAELAPIEVFKEMIVYYNQKDFPSQVRESLAQIIRQAVLPFGQKRKIQQVMVADLSSTDAVYHEGMKIFIVSKKAMNNNMIATVVIPEWMENLSDEQLQEVWDAVEWKPGTLAVQEVKSAGQQPASDDDEIDIMAILNEDASLDAVLKDGTGDILADGSRVDTAMLAKDVEDIEHDYADVISAQYRTKGLNPYLLRESEQKIISLLWKIDAVLKAGHENADVLKRFLHAHDFGQVLEDMTHVNYVIDEKDLLHGSELGQLARTVKVAMGATDPDITGVDAAMLTEDSKRQDGMDHSDLGGIDLNPEQFDLQIKRDGNGVPLPVIDQPIETMRIDGFCPVLINITPIQSLPLLMGFGEEGEGEQGPRQQTAWNAGMDYLYREEYYDWRLAVSC